MSCRRSIVTGRLMDVTQLLSQRSSRRASVLECASPLALFDLPLPPPYKTPEGWHTPRPRGYPIAILLIVLGAATALALDEVPYSVAKESWEEGLGNHRAVVHVEQKVNAVLAKIPWRRRDRDPEHKQIIVVDAASSQRITNIARLHLDRFEGVIAFQPQTAPADYYIYYLPFKPQPGWGNYNYDYLPLQDSASSDWKAHLSADTNVLPRATVVRLEARTEFDSFYPMEVVATPEETQALLSRTANFPLQHSLISGVVERSPGPPPYLLFPEDRRFPIRMKDDLPLRWVKSGPAGEFRGEAQRNEFYVFQLGVWSIRTNLTVFDLEFRGDICGWLNCFNTGGTNWDGKPFHKTINVPQSKIQALWIGVDVPPDAAPGEHHATITIRPVNAPPADIELRLNVLPTSLDDRGDGEPWRLARLRWLDSSRAATLWPPDDDHPWKARSNEDKLIRTANQTLATRDDQLLPVSIRSGQTELLSQPIHLVAVRGDMSALPMSDAHVLETFLSARVNNEEAVRWIADKAFQFEDGSAGLKVHSETTVEADGYVRCRFDAASLSGPASEAYSDLRLEIPLHPDVAKYFMGIGLPACRTPTNYTWRWTGPYNSFWIGNTHAGLHVKLLGSTYEGPLQNLYHPKPPPSWFNDGRGGVTITNGPKGETVVQVFTGPFELKAGEERMFDFSLLVTPVKPLDTAAHFRERYWHSHVGVLDDVNVINVHHATLPNPFINYPFLAVDRLRAFCRTNQAAGKKVKIYYTVRELTTHLPELWALRSLGDEVLADGPAGGFPWLREHLGSGYTPAWYNVAEGGVVDAAILTSGASRWYNFYVEGINWLVRNIPIDGLYLDDVAYDRTILKRVRKVLDRARPGCLIDLHSNTLFSKGPANQYTEFFPYVDRLWFGEGFNYDAMSPEQWLVESSGIPFGLMGDMLEGGGNRWRGMVFGMTTRLPWVNSGPREVWKVWDDFGIGASRMRGWWETDCPVRTGRADVLATAYVKPGKTLVALASWASEKSDVRLQIDWKALGLDPGKARLVAPEIKDFQPAKTWQGDEAIEVAPGRGWLIYVVE